MAHDFLMYFLLLLEYQWKCLFGCLGCVGFVGFVEGQERRYSYSFFGATPDF